MRRTATSLASILCVLGGLGCKQAPEAAEIYRPIVGTRLLMVAMLDPAADIVWDSVGTIITEEGVEEIQPHTEEEWTLVRNNAIVVAEAGNLLMMSRRAQDNGEWMDWSRALIDAGEKAMQAAEARNPEKVFDTGGEIYAACSGCHEKYLIGQAGTATSPASDAGGEPSPE